MLSSLLMVQPCQSVEQPLASHPPFQIIRTALDEAGLGPDPLAAIDAVEAAGVDPCDAAPDHWRHVHQRITAGHQPRLYTAERHTAWLKRREIEG